MTPSIVGIADLQRKTKAILQHVRKTKKPWMIVSHHIPKAVLMDIDTYEELAQELMRYRAEAHVLKNLRIAEKEVAQGKVIKGNLDEILSSF